MTGIKISDLKTGTVVQLDSGRYGFVTDNKDGHTVCMYDGKPCVNEEVTAVIATPEKMAVEFGVMMNGGEGEGKLDLICGLCGEKTSCRYCGAPIFCTPPTVDELPTEPHELWCDRCNDAQLYKFAGNPHFTTILQIYLDTGDNAPSIWRSVKKELHLEMQVAKLTALLDDVSMVLNELSPCPAHGHGCIPHATRLMRSYMNQITSDPVDPIIKVDWVDYVTHDDLGYGNTDYLVITLSNHQRISIPNDPVDYITTTMSHRKFDKHLQEDHVAGRQSMSHSAKEFFISIKNKHD